MTDEDRQKRIKDLRRAAEQINRLIAEAEGLSPDPDPTKWVFFNARPPGPDGRPLAGWHYDSEGVCRPDGAEEREMGRQLVDDLRAVEKSDFDEHLPYSPTGQLCQDAADEIERLERNLKMADQKIAKLEQEVVMCLGGRPHPSMR